MTSKLYSIEVTADIASKIRTLAETGVFAMKSGSCEVHCDPQGNIVRVVIHTHHQINNLNKLSTPIVAPQK